MKQLFKQYKSVLKFLLWFIGSYVLLASVYGGYLKFTGTPNSPDPITRLVALQAENILQSFQIDGQVMANPGEPSMQLWVAGEWVGKIVEGCNAISIIILFAAFVIAFSKGWKKTLLFILAGCILIYTVNLVRISILAVALYKYPEHQEILHTVIFPGTIYSMVFLLWMLWVRKQQPKNQKDA